MNKRARNRLIGVTVIILGVAAAVFFGFGNNPAYSISVEKALSDPALVGKRVQVTGSVVPGSWDKKMNPMKFKIRGEKAKGGPELSVVYTGSAPNTFGDDTVAIVTGILQEGAKVDATDMTTKCPSKYTSGSEAMTVTELLDEKPGHPVGVWGYLKPGSLNVSGQGAERFVLTSEPSGGDEVRVLYEGTMPKGTEDGVTLVVEGQHVETDVVEAADVSRLAKQ